MGKPEGGVLCKGLNADWARAQKGRPQMVEAVAGYLGANVGTCRNTVRKPKAQLESKLAKEAKGNRKDFCNYVGSKRESKGNMALLLSAAMWKKGFCDLDFAGETCPQASQMPEPPIRVKQYLQQRKMVLGIT